MTRLVDDTALAYTRARLAQAIDRIRRGTTICACGGEYQDAPDGRRRHQTLHGHRPSPAPAGGVR